jgi:ATP-dependent DNA helicase RecQ
MNASTKINPREILKKHFGWSDFLSGQQDVIQRLIDGDSVLAVFPTGGGKSLCYQLPALTFDGITVVVSPLIALM